uniref:Uncharacterized protein n=1 Tax=Physcomitrium patens TaxID=3218 RepID=A0A2K1KJD9_PHYPA|nr:hypothetical protein PHYPA_007558 [Physcomitrium patens]
MPHIQGRAARGLGGRQLVKGDPVQGMRDAVIPPRIEDTANSVIGRPHLTPGFPGSFLVLNPTRPGPLRPHPAPTDGYAMPSLELGCH